METDHYPRETRTILDTLVKNGHEMPLLELLQQSNVDLFIGPTVISRLLAEEKVTFQIKDGVQYFRLQPKVEKSKPHSRKKRRTKE